LASRQCRDPPLDDGDLLGWNFLFGRRHFAGPQSLDEQTFTSPARDDGWAAVAPLGGKSREAQVQISLHLLAAVTIEAISLENRPHLPLEGQILGPGRAVAWKRQQNERKEATSAKHHARARNRGMIGRRQSWLEAGGWVAHGLTAGLIIGRRRLKGKRALTLHRQERNSPAVSSALAAAADCLEVPEANR
jgi:hypothetical protein